MRLDGEPHDGLTQAVAHLSCAPLFESDVEPEFTESFQLEAINGWLMLEEALGEMSEERTERLVSLAREMAVYLDDYMDAVLTPVDGEEDRKRYLADVGQDLRVCRLGYFGTRNIEVERRCHEAILAGAAGDALEAPLGHSVQAACDAYSDELLASLRGLRGDSRSPSSG